MMAMLHHEYDTQKNEAMNNSVASYGPKFKTYSLADSLLVRIAIAAGVQIQGYEKFWAAVFNSSHLDFNHNLVSELRQKDVRKTRRTVRDDTKTGKVTRGQGWSEKFHSAKKGYLEELRTGMAYKSGIALKNAKKVINDAPVVRNPKGTPRDQW